MAEIPILIAVAPNGARKTREDHSGLPLTPLELARTACACAEAGAGMIHLHVRDNRGHHTLEPEYYRAALRELEAAVGDRMLLQVSSESAGFYRAEEQMAMMRQLAPPCLSCGLREFAGDRQGVKKAGSFFHDLYQDGVMIQYILYSAEDVQWYETLCDEGVIPGSGHLLLFVIGRYGQPSDVPGTLQPFVASLKRPSPWMACAFGQEEHRIAQEAVMLGGHIRVGFENNLQLADGSVAPDNSALVKSAVNCALSLGRSPGDRAFAELLHRSA